MSDYISREAAKEAVQNALAFHSYAGGTAASALDKIPAADVRPVVIGKWLEREDMYYGWNIWECSNCHEEFCIEEGTPKDNEYKFCPNCGAEMKEEQT